MPYTVRSCRPFSTHLVSAPSMSSTSSQASRASGDVAPYFLLASMAFSMAELASGRDVVRSNVDVRAVKVVGAKALVVAGRARDARRGRLLSFMVCLFDRLEGESLIAFDGPESFCAVFASSLLFGARDPINRGATLPIVRSLVCSRIF